MRIGARLFGQRTTDRSVDGRARAAGWCWRCPFASLCQQHHYPAPRTTRRRSLESAADTRARMSAHPIGCLFTTFVAVAVTTLYIYIYYYYYYHYYYIISHHHHRIIIIITVYYIITITEYAMSYIYIRSHHRRHIIIIWYTHRRVYTLCIRMQIAIVNSTAVCRISSTSGRRSTKTLCVRVIGTIYIWYSGHAVCLRSDFYLCWWVSPAAVPGAVRTWPRPSMSAVGAAETAKTVASRWARPPGRAGSSDRPLRRRRPSPRPPRPPPPSTSPRPPPALAVRWRRHWPVPRGRWPPRWSTSSS